MNTSNRLLIALVINILLAWACMAGSNAINAPVNNMDRTFQQAID